MHVVTEHVLGRPLIEEIYPSYVQAWEHLLPHVAARHVLTFEEFAEEMTDPRVEKLLVLSDHGGHVMAMTTLVRDIDAVPWANAHFYRIRYPSEIARGAFFYVGYTLVHRPDRGTRAVAMMRQAMDDRLRDAQGVICFDMSTFVNDGGFGRRLHRLCPSARQIDRLDSQSYFVADYRPEKPPEESPTSAAPDFRCVSLAERPDLLEEMPELLSARWPLFMLAGHPGHDVALTPLLAGLPDLQVALIDGDGSLRGMGLAVPIAWDGSLAGLPAGWDDAVSRGAEMARAGGRPDAVSALSITIAPGLAGQQLGSFMISGMRAAARRSGASALIAPVRPSLKSRYPLTDIEDYLDWTVDGRVFDPWVRAHRDLGGEVLGVARSSMTITGSAEEWEGWLGLALPASGSYVIAGGLVPLEVDRDEDQAIYREPNVWVHHRL